MEQLSSIQILLKGDEGGQNHVSHVDGGHDLQSDDRSGQQDAMDSAARCLPLDSNTISVLSQVMEQQEVFQLQIHENGVENNEGGLSVEDGDTQVILVYQDILTCGACSKQFIELTEFLHHKVQHTIGETGLFKCELCKVVYMDTTSLSGHYKQHHRVLISEMQQEDSLPESDMHNQDQVAEGQFLHSEERVEGVEEHSDVNTKEGIITHKNHSNDHNQEADRSSITSRGNEEDSSDPINTVIENKSETGQAKELPHDPVGLSVGIKCETHASRSPSKRIKARRHAGLRPHLANWTSTDENLEGGSTREGVDDVNANQVKREAHGRNVDFSFILIMEMVKGNTFSYGKTWFKCLHCEYKTTGKIMIGKHMNEKHKDMLELHKTLDVKENLQNDKKKVMKMSTYEALYGREERFKRRNRRGQKMEKQDVPGVYPCDRCGKVFHRLRYLRKHSLTHRSEKKFVCEECGKPFKSKTYLTVHRRTHNEKVFKCNQCDFTSKVNAAIHAHRQFHSQGSVLCDICGFAYTDKSTLNKHKRVHDLERPYACNFPGCTWRFKTDVMCKAHVRAHTTEGKFKCPYCGYAFRHKHHLQRHESNTHGVKHSKARMQSPKSGTDVLDSEFQNMVNCVVIEHDTSEQLQANGCLSQQHLVVATDTNGTPITFGSTDISALNVAYQSLLSTQEGEHQDTQTILLTQPEGHIVFQQE